MANIASIDKLIESEKRKLLTAIKAHPFWFVDVPKTSSTAIKYLLGQNYGWPFGLSKYLDSNGNPIQKIGRSLLFPDHTPAFLAKSFIGEEVWNSIDTFAVVRHPYRWCLSMWLHSMTLSASNLGLRVDTFDHFLNSIEKKFDGPHTERKVFVNSYRQVDYLLDSTDKMIVKFIFKLEDRASIDEFLKKKGILEYGKTHLMYFGNETKSKDYQLTKGQMKRINSIFEKDFELLGY